MVIGTAIRKTTDSISDFLRLEAAGGLLLAAMAALALICSNTPLRLAYDALLNIPAEIRFGSFAVAKLRLLWINDGLMAIFFLLVGLEVKREVIEGELSTPAQIVLPVVAGLGGMLVPALVFLLVNRGSGAALNGWAIPTATDIAFALGILSLLGDRVPASLKIFLTAVAIADDLGAIVIIALFYTAELSVSMLLFAGVAIALLIALTLFKVTQIAPYMIIGVFPWVFVLKSGVHATLAGVAAAFAVPLPLGIAAGLFAGKFVGVCGASAVLIGLGLAKLPAGANWPQLAGVAALCGVGFTMSLFIGSLAFEGPEYFTPIRLEARSSASCRH